QPRVGISMSGQRHSRYASLYGSEPGIDPYTRAVSDVYQDLFGEGSFVGKGIYDVDAFEHALAGRMPDNRILSHDLLEGCYARAGLVSDVQLYEDYPARYAVDVKRRHRWIRGDWQLLPWLLPLVPLQPAAAAPTKARERNPLSMLSRGQLLDNLRRSLFPSALPVLLVLGSALAAGAATARGGGAGGGPPAPSALAAVPGCAALPPAAQPVSRCPAARPAAALGARGPPAGGDAVAAAEPAAASDARPPGRPVQAT